MKRNKFNYASAPQRDSVIVVAGGQSTGNNAKKIIEYQNKNNSLVMASNYNYKDLLSDYTYFTDIDKLIENIDKIESPIIMTHALFKMTRKDKSLFESMKNFEKKYSIYTVCDIKNKQLQKDRKRVIYQTYREGGISISSKGDFPYFELGTSGLGSLAISILFKPKKILISGFDGPKKGNKTKMKHDGQEVPYGKNLKNKIVRKHFSKSLIPTLRREGVMKIETFDDVLLYGLKKDKLGIRVI